MPPFLAVVIVVLTLAGVALGRVPMLRMNRATVALAGAALLLAGGFISLADAYRLLDLDTLVLLFAMMVVNVHLRMAGFFRLVGDRVLHLARGPFLLLFLLVLVAGVLSALFLNDTIVLMFTPLVLELAAVSGRNPIPYLVGLATAANVGSMATITGNPQNMIIGVASDISFARFAARLAPPALLGLVATFLIVALVYRRALGQRFAARPPLPDARFDRALLWKCCVVTGGMLVLLLAGTPVALAALLGATVLLISRRIRPEEVFQAIDWGLLVFFAALFVVTGSLQVTGHGDALTAAVLPAAEGGVLALSAVAAVLSNLVSNVPAVLLLRPLVPDFRDPETAWLVLAMATTLAGNLTLLGAVCNLIVAEVARERGVTLSFREFLKAGVPVTLATLAIGVAWLAWT